MNNLGLTGSVNVSSNPASMPTTELDASLTTSIRHSRERATAPRSPELVARQLPDSLFEHDPEVRQLRVFLRIEERRANGATAELAGQVGCAIPALEAKLRSLHACLDIAALDDAIGADFEFSGATALMEEIQGLENQIKAAHLAYRLLSMSPPQKQPYFAERVSRARNALGTRLMELKRAHVQDHPEVLTANAAQVNTEAPVAEENIIEADEVVTKNAVTTVVTTEDSISEPVAIDAAADAAAQHQTEGNVDGGERDAG